LQLSVGNVLVRDRSAIYFQRSILHASVPHNDAPLFNFVSKTNFCVFRDLKKKWGGGNSPDAFLMDTWDAWNAWDTSAYVNLLEFNNLLGFENLLGF
jgi:hypothetical protein